MAEPAKASQNLSDPAASVTDASGHEKAEPGTIYWTLSLFIEPERVAQAAGQAGTLLRHDQFGALQTAHLPSRILRDSIEPLFNDIADREVLGEVQEHLLSAATEPVRAEGVTDDQHRLATVSVRARGVISGVD